MSSWDRQVEWRQGDFLPPDAIKHFDLTLPESEPIVVVATHDCDLAQAYENEPSVEIIIGKIVENLDGNLTYSKNSRKLHIEVELKNTSIVEFYAIHKRFLDKNELFSNFSPMENGSLKAENKFVFRRWLASRYNRSAFPEEFERRLLRETGLAQKLAQIIKPTEADIILVAFDVDEGEEIERMESDDTYLLDIYLIYKVDNEGAKISAQDSVGKITSKFKTTLLEGDSWKFIELRYCEAISEEALTYNMYRFMKPWRLEHMSLKSDSPVVPE